MTLIKDEEIIRRGCKAKPKIIRPSSTLVKTLTILDEGELASAHYQVHKMSLKEATSRTQAFFGENFKLHEVLISKPISLGKRYCSVVQPSTPFNIPLAFVKSDDIFSGSIVENFLKDEGDRILFKNIYLNNIITEHTSIQYVHELTHTQVDSQRESITNYYDLEVLSIFLELVHAYSIDPTENQLRINDSRRILEMLTVAEQLLATPHAHRDTLLEDSKYLSSSLKAYNLFMMYFYGDNNIRKEMLQLVQQVFDGQISLEDLLSKYDITFENSQDEKRLMKYFNR